MHNILLTVGNSLHSHQSLCYYSRCKNTGAIATACGDDNIRVFVQEVTSDPDQPTFTLMETVHKAHTQDVNAVTWNPKQPGLLASCSDEGDVKLWMFQTDSWPY